MRRITSPLLNDPIARGVRAIMRKLEPGERIVYGLRTVAARGVEPVAFATGLAAAVRIARETGQTHQGLREVLAGHCGLAPDRDAELAALVEAQDAALARSGPS